MHCNWNVYISKQRHNQNGKETRGKKMMRKKRAEKERLTWSKVYCPSWPVTLLLNLDNLCDWDREDIQDFSKTTTIRKRWIQPMNDRTNASTLFLSTRATWSPRDTRGFWIFWISWINLLPSWNCKRGK